MFETLARKYGIVALFFALLFTILYGSNGVLDYLSMRRDVSAKEISIKKMEAENIALKGQVERMQKDTGYIEDLARSKYGFIKEGEKVYRIEK